MPKNYLIPLLLSFFCHQKIISQCTVSITGDTCVKGLLNANYTGNQLTKLTWKVNDSIVYTSVPTGFSSEWSAVVTGIAYANSIFTDKNNNTYIADVNSRKILKYSPSTNTTVSLLTVDYDPYDICVFNDTIYIAGAYSPSVNPPFILKKYAPGSLTGITLAGYGSSIPLGETRSVCVNKSGTVYIANGSRVQRINQITNTAPVVVASNTQIELGIDLQVDDSGNIYVLDYFNSYILKWKPNAATSAGVIVAGGNGNGAADNQLSEPNQMFLDKKGNVYIAEQNNGRISKWQLGASAGLTVAGGAVYNAIAPNTSLVWPGSVSMDTSGNLLAGDGGALKRFTISDAVFTKYISAIGGNHTVTSTALNNCSYTSNPFFITATPPPPPASITGPSTVTALQTGIVYSVPAIPGITYNWTIAKKTATIISGQGTPSITVNWNSLKGKISVTARNSCGFLSPATIKHVKVATAQIISSNLIDIKFPKTKSMTVSPNPAHDRIKVSFNSIIQTSYELVLTDLAGKILLQKKSIATTGENITSIDISKFARGVYILSIVDKTNNIRFQKIIKE